MSLQSETNTLVIIIAMHFNSFLLAYLWTHADDPDPRSRLAVVFFGSSQSHMQWRRGSVCLSRSCRWCLSIGAIYN